MTLFAEMSEAEKQAFRQGQEIVIDEFMSYISELEDSRNSQSSYGKGQLYILRELVRKLCQEAQS